VKARLRIRIGSPCQNAYYSNNRGTVWRTRKLYDLAIPDFNAAIRLNPEYDPRLDEAYLSRAWLLASCPITKSRDPRKAVESATSACELTDWHEAHDLGGLAAVYAETGNVAAALKWQSKAIEVMTAGDKTKMKESFALGHP
jgi:tetratricopeptide (TPR) repeat protein